MPLQTQESCGIIYLQMPIRLYIPTTGNYLRRARNPEKLMSDKDMALLLRSGNIKLNLHASCAIFVKKPAEYFGVKYRKNFLNLR